MDPKPPPSRYLAAPPPSSSSALSLPQERAWPRVDDQLVQPETREEVVRGQRVTAAPAKEPHAERHIELDYVVRASIAPGYVGATDLLTRLGPESDLATDTCIRRAGIDPQTGARYLEELAFEIVAEQSMRDITIRAEDLSTRGVRRVLAIFVKTGEVREWSADAGDWIVLDPEGVLEDATLARPIPVRALVDAASADDVVARALQAKDNPVIKGIEAAGVEQGTVKGIEALCDVLSIPIDADRRARLEQLDATGLEALLNHIRAERRWP